MLKNKLFKIKSQLLASLFIAIAGNAQAGVTYAHNPSDGGDAFFSNTSAGAILAENFSVGKSFSLEALSWWGSYDSPEQDSFLFDIYSDAGGAPGTKVLAGGSASVTRSSTSLTDFWGDDVFRYNYVLPTALSLAAGTYYLSVTNETSQSGWYWMTSSSGDGRQWSSTDGSVWLPESFGDLAFSVQYTEAQVSAVPEPSTALLMVSGLLMLTGKRQRSVRNLKAV